MKTVLMIIGIVLVCAMATFCYAAIAGGNRNRGDWDEDIE